MSSWGSSTLTSGTSSTRCPRPVPAMEAIRKDGESRHPHGSLSRPGSARIESGTGATAHQPVVLPGGESHSGSFGDSLAKDLDRAPARPAGVSEEPRFRKGRAHDRIVVAEVGRTVTSSWTHAVEGNRGGVTKRNATGGNTSEAGVITRPMEGAPDHQHDDDRHGSSWSGGLGCALADASSLRWAGISSSRRKPGVRKHVRTGASP